MWMAIKEIFARVTNLILQPTVVHCDNELAFINATKEEFQGIKIQTCLYHIADNMKTHLQKNGFNFNSEDCPEIVKEQFYIIKAMLFLNLQDSKQLQLSLLFLQVFAYIHH